MKKTEAKEKKKHNIRRLVANKFLLFIALACEIVSLAIEKGHLQISPEWANRYALAGVAITIVYFSFYGFSARSQKYRYYKNIRNAGNQQNSNQSENK